MATMSWKSLAMLWTIAFTMILASSTEAAKAPSPSPKKCWGCFTQISGCAAEIGRAAATMQPSMRIGHDCCKAIVKLDDKCWAQMFPMNHRASSLLKGICSSVMASPRPAAAASNGININATVLAGDVHDGAAPGPHN